MVTIQFALNEAKIKAAGHTVANVENYLRKFYGRMNAKEIAYLTFQRDDEHAMCDLGRIGYVMRKDPLFLSFLEKCVWDVDGEVEDCIKELGDYIAKNGR